ncbi:terminase large subunit domain-containing protein [Pedobacter sp. MR2016-24]|uniref:terminase large subunit domain-containing protein n=1 Tax=Pedobacter sp. MR2016-24 TaxID=2994466 RepID=UPI00224756BD|nr:terminase family protein [Pedobacter sp. MR2016-24]MCX2486596.1 terminase family protein [Pedobacter sp. MR2016-24]
MVELVLQQLHPAQQTIFNSTERNVIVMAGRQFGKSSLCIQKIVHCLLGIDNNGVGENAFYITPYYKLAKKFYRDLVNAFPSELIESDNKTDLQITLKNGAFVQLYSADNMDAIRGNNEISLVILDEAAYYDVETLYGDVIEPMLGIKDRGRCIIVSTPNSTNGFFRMWQAATDGMDDWEAFKYTAYDNPFWSKERLDKIKANARSIIKFNQEYLCEVSATEACPFEYEYIQKARTSVLSTKKTVCYGIDVALGKGNQTGDWTAITGLDDTGHITYFDRFRIPSSALQFNKMDVLDKNTLKVIDSTSVGNWYYEQLQNSGHYVEGMSFTNSNKTDMVYEFVNATEKEEVKVNDIIADEMQIYEARLTKSNNYQFGNQAGKNNYDDALTSAMLAYKGLSDYGLKSGGGQWSVYSV